MSEEKSIIEAIEFLRETEQEEETQGTIDFLRELFSEPPPHISFRNVYEYDNLFRIIEAHPVKLADCISAFMLMVVWIIVVIVMLVVLVKVVVVLVVVAITNMKKMRIKWRF
ncbi:hypothetical protein BD770DRAFT_412178 [Pilaira anomala]|nr:hypothetical protein BD770DRAFT_412178 [Pilaira anomala]